MRRHRLRMGRLAAATRLNKTDTKNVSNDIQPNIIQPSTKRKNPFKLNDSIKDTNKKVKDCDDDESETDNSLFRLLGLTDPQMNNTETLNINDILKKIKEQNEKTAAKVSGDKSLIVDWSFRSKVRFMSPKPFPWTQTLKTCEEACGTTGFVRCMGGGNESQFIDTSPNAVFHQCCLYWQHPSLPWLQLFPRSSKQSDVDKVPLVGSQPKIRDSLHRDWADSFRSLFQLVRVRHCPYFYMVANTFTCLFRAAGVNGQSEINAMLSSTTLGFRQLLKEEGVQFTMPMKKKDALSQSLENDQEIQELDIDEEDEPGETREWLASLGVGEEEIKRISSSQEMMSRNAKKKIDGDYDSLIYIEGCEAQALFNFLINCKSITPTTGMLSGVPPTLIAPVAFVGATLHTLKVRESIVNVDNEVFHSMEIRGPIFPHTVINLCQILEDWLDKFSVTFATIDSTKAFSMAARHSCPEPSSESDKEAKNKPGQAFSLENLSDCGLHTTILERFCSDEVRLYDCIKYSDKLYVWT
ncbi:hypothetical protein AAG570_011088 [Ranatra chinensis]|uniref:Uncharacterized protein n=1 Tax=Ranatra chinensis TaxID=642074 RepID=A0ABD0YJL4_9HEMI